MIVLVAAMGRGRVIGQGGKMPWHLPGEMKHFRQTTRGQVVVMGRKTYESIGGALKDRTNVVVTRDPHYQAPGCEVVHSISSLLEYERPVYVIGGEELYSQFLPYARRMVLTRIDGVFPGDTFFPRWDEAKWQLVASDFHPRDEKNAYDFTIETYERIRT